MKQIIFGLLIVSLFLFGCSGSQNPAQEVLANTLANYRSFNSYKVTVTAESKIFYTEQVPVGKPTTGEKPEIVVEEKSKVGGYAYDLVFKKPDKIKIVRDSGSINFFDDSGYYTYNPESNIACKLSSKKPTFLNERKARDIVSLLDGFAQFYNLEYLGLEEFNGEEHHVIRIVPKIGLDPSAGLNMDEQRLWITQDYFLAKTETLREGEWIYRTTYSNIETNINLSASEFKLPKNAIVLPKTFTFSTIEEAEQVYGHEIKAPTYLPEGVSLNSVEVFKDCASSTVSLTYFKNSQKSITLTEFGTPVDRSAEIPENDFTGFDGPYEVEKQGVTLYYDAMVHGYEAEFLNANNAIVEWTCKATGVTFILESHPPKLELGGIEKMLRSFRCY